MVFVAISTGITIEEFEQLPDALVRNRELVNGELVDVAGNTGSHNSVRDFLIARLLPFVEERNLGRVISEQEFAFGENAHGPDVSFMGSAKARRFDPRRRVQEFVPDLAIEIVSANDKFTFLMGKGGPLPQVRHERGVDSLAGHAPGFRAV
jgi:Uma2 family endonuclease